MARFIALSTILAFAGCATVGQVYWDTKVKEMCLADGGIKIIETVSLNKQQYDSLLNRFGQLSPPLESSADESIPIVHRLTSTFINQSNPEVRRDELVVIRNSDKKTLAVQVLYSRVGGDAVALHPSSFSCPDTAADFFSMVVRQQ